MSSADRGTWLAAPAESDALIPVNPGRVRTYLHTSGHCAGLGPANRLTAYGAFGRFDVDRMTGRPTAVGFSALIN